MAASLGFGLVFELQNAFSSEASQIERSLGGIANASRNLERDFANTVNNITQGFALMKAGTAILDAAGSTVNAAAQLEQQQMSFETMLGSASKARDMIKQIQQFAAATPYETPEITQAAKQMMAYGFAQEKIIPTMRTLGDVASGLNIPLSQLTYLYGTVKTAGYAGLIDIRQFANRGIPIWEELSKVTGKTVKELTGMRGLKVPFEQVEQAFKNMAGAGGKFGGLMEAQSKTYNGLTSTFNDNITLMQQEFGGILLPYLKMGIDFFIGVAQAASEFAQTPLGKFLFLSAVAVGILLFVVGSVILAMSLARYASLSLANSFMAMGKASIANAFATQGLTGGLRALAVSAWQALLPFLPYIAIAAAVAGAFMLINDAVNAYSDYISEAGMKGKGFTLFLQQLGGFVTALVQAFSSFDGTSFDLGGMEARLAELGILDLVLNMATWVVRIKTIFTSIITAFGDIIGYIGGVVSSVMEGLGKVFKPVIDYFNNFSPTIDKTTNSLDNWALAGKIIAGFIVGGLIVGVIALTVAMWGLVVSMLPFLLFVGVIALVVAAIVNWKELCDLFMKNVWAKFGDQIKFVAGAILVILMPTIVSATLGFLSLAASVFVLFWPLIALIAIVIGLVALFFYWDEVWTFVSTNFIKGINWLGGLFGQFFSWIGDLFVGFLNWLISIPEMFVSWGASIVENIKNGIANAWEGFKTWFLGKIMDIPGVALAMEAMGGGGGGGQFGGLMKTRAELGVQGVASTVTDGMFANIGNITAEQRAQQYAQNTPNVNVNVPASEKQPINIILDGEIITKTVNNKNENDRNRRNG